MQGRANGVIKVTGAVPIRPVRRTERNRTVFVSKVPERFLKLKMQLLLRRRRVQGILTMNNKTSEGRLGRLVSKSSKGSTRDGASNGLLWNASNMLMKFSNLNSETTINNIIGGIGAGTSNTAISCFQPVTNSKLAGLFGIGHDPKRLPEQPNGESVALHAEVFSGVAAVLVSAGLALARARGSRTRRLRRSSASINSRRSARRMTNTRSGGRGRRPWVAVQCRAAARLRWPGAVACVSCDSVAS